MFEWLNTPATPEWVQGYLIGIICGSIGSLAITAAIAYPL